MMPTTTWYKYIQACLIAVLVIWKPLLVVLFPGWIPNVGQGNVGVSTLPTFVLCLLDVLIAALILKKLVVPPLFGQEAWTSFDDLKRRVLVGYFVKIIGRASCFIQIAIFVASQMGVGVGVFGKSIVLSSEEAGMTLEDSVAMRGWIVGRYSMMSVMVWDLACNPELSVDSWLHHIFLIFGGCLTTDPQLLTSQENVRPFIDSVVIFWSLGGSWAGLVETCNIMYHLNSKNPKNQAMWMQSAICLQLIMVIVFFVTLPTLVLIKHNDHIGQLASVIVALIVILVAIEAKNIFVKISVVKHAESKASVLHLEMKEKKSKSLQTTEDGTLLKKKSYQGKEDIIGHPPNRRIITRPC